MPALALACRGCLAVNVRLYNIYKNNLLKDFEEILGEPIFKSGDLAPYICAICHVQLLKYVSFRKRVRFTQDLLTGWKQKGVKLTTRFIGDTIGRKPFDLLNLNIFTPPASNLDIKIIEMKPRKKLSETVNNIELNEEQDLEGQWSTEFLDEDILSEDIVFLNSSLEEQQSCDNVEPIPDDLTLLHSGDENSYEQIEEEIQEQSLPDDQWSLHSSDENFSEQIKQEELEQCSPNVSDDPEQTAPPPKTTNETKKLKRNERVRNLKSKKFKEKYNFDVTFLTKEQQIKEAAERIRQSIALLALANLTYCPECGKRCFSPETLEIHMKKCHDESLGVACEVCRCRFPSEKLLTHSQTHSLKLSCKECDFTTNSFMKAKNHADEHRVEETDTIYSCEHCAATFEKKIELNVHIYENHQDSLLWCKYCGDTFVNETSLNNHIRMLHRNIYKSEHRCNVCDLTFATKEALETHLSLTCEEFTCVVCGIHEESEYLLRDHVASKHAKGCFKLELCEGCGVKFFGAESYSKHKEDCGSGCPCEECGETLPDANSLLMHKGDFHKTTYRVCDMCDLVFYPKKYFVHMARSHNRKPGLVKKELPKVRTRVWTVNGGVIKGTGVTDPKSAAEQRKFICHYCGKGYAKNQYLLVHVRQKHTHVGRYKCDYCPKAFNRKERCLDHMRFHTGEKPFKCTLCPNTFRIQNTLAKHMKVHMNIRTHICHLCDKKFRSSTCVKAHIRSVHLKIPSRNTKNPSTDQSHSNGTQGHMNETQGHMKETRGHTKNIQVHTEGNDTEYTDNSELNDPNGFKKRKTNRNRHKIQNETAEDIAPCKVKFKNISKTDSQIDTIEIDDNVLEEYEIESVPRIIKTIHIKGRKRRCVETQYLDSVSQNVVVETTSYDY